MDHEIQKRLKSISLHIKSMSFIWGLSFLCIAIFGIFILKDFQKATLATPYMSICAFALLVSSAIIVILQNQKFIIKQHFQQKTKTEPENRPNSKAPS